MRVLGMVGLVVSVGLVPRIAAAGHHHDGPEVHDHRSSSSDSHSSSHSEPVVRDHRSSSSDSTPVVRDHRSSSGGSSGTVYYEEPVVEEVAVNDSGASPNPFANMHGPTWIFEMGGFAQRFRGPAFDRSGSVETLDGSSASYGFASGTPTEGDTAGGAFGMRFIVPATEHYYAGVELGIGGLTRTPITLMTDAASDLHVASRTMVGTNAVFGARTRHGIAELDGELAGGLRVVSMTVQSMGAGEDDPSSTESALSGVVEARLRGALWVAPHVFLAAQAGVGVLDRSDVNVGLSFGIASRPFGQTR